MKSNVSTRRQLALITCGALLAAGLRVPAKRAVDALRRKGIVVEHREALCERISDEVESAVLNHEPQVNDSHCSCGVRNNMDGDVLHAHRMTEIAAAIERAVTDV